VKSAIKAGVAYFVAVFAAGFMLGAVRVFVIAPRIGAFWAVAMELPIMLAVAWVACGWAVRRFTVPAAAGERATMGLAAFVLLMTAEAALAIATGSTPTHFLASLATPEGALGLSGQGIFALMPLLRQ
jgi:hypothetical protein